MGAFAPAGSNIAVLVSLTTTAAGWHPKATSSLVICATSLACSCVDRGGAGVVGVSEVVTMDGGSTFDGRAPISCHADDDTTEKGEQAR